MPGSRSWLSGWSRLTSRGGLTPWAGLAPRTLLSPGRTRTAEDRVGDVEDSGARTRDGVGLVAQGPEALGLVAPQSGQRPGAADGAQRPGDVTHRPRQSAYLAKSAEHFTTGLVPAPP